MNDETNKVRLSSEADKQKDEAAVWTYRGYKMRPAEFNTAWVHYYWAEIQCNNIWRTRLDATTNGPWLPLLPLSLLPFPALLIITE